MMKHIKVILTVFGLILVPGTAIHAQDSDKDSPKKSDPKFEYIKQSDMFQSVLRDLMIYYVDTIRPEKIVKPAINEMLDKLDPYTIYMTDKEVDDFDVLTTGKYGGVGALIGVKGSWVRIIDPYKGFPADKAGLKPGDLLLKINNTSLENMSVEKVSNLLKGDVGTGFDLEYKRAKSGEVVKVKVIREKIQIPAVPYFGMLKDTKIGYISFVNFSTDCSSEVKNAIQILQKQGMTSLILDLRGNGGGLLDEAAKVANFFLPKNKQIAYAKGKLKSYDLEYKTNSKPLVPDLPLVVLVNEGSASAAEIVAGAFQDYDRAVLIGRNTFGKGLVQTVIPHAYGAKLKVTTAKYYIPSGRCIQLIDYTHRREDGSAGSIPDSLRKAFKTAKGRTVYDGGGVCPEILMDQIELSNIEYSLFLRGYMQEFAIDYYTSLDSLPNPDEKDLPKTMFDEFSKFLQGKDYSYQTVSQDRLKALIESTKKENYYAQLQPMLDSMQRVLFHDKEKELQMNKEHITTTLEAMIYTAYQYQSGRYRLMFRKDPAIAKAKEVLESAKMYESFLDKDKVIK